MTIRRLRHNVAGVLVSTVDNEACLYDSTAVRRGLATAWDAPQRDLCADPRSRDRSCF